MTRSVECIGGCVGLQLNSCPRFPSPLKTLGNSLCRLCSVASILVTNVRVVIAGRPSNDIHGLLSLYSLVDKGKPDATPYALHTPRHIAMPLRPQVEEELKRMESMGVISKVDEPTP